MPSASGDFLSILSIISAHETEFIVVGGVCAVLHGAPVTTFDVDIVHRRTEANVARLLAALSELNAQYRHVGPRVLKPGERDLQGRGHHLLVTENGPLDVLGQVGDSLDFGDLVARSALFDLGDGLILRVLNLDALIEIKRAVGRDKDLAVLPILERVLQEVLASDGVDDE